VAFGFAIAASIIAAIASGLTGRNKPAAKAPAEPIGSELAAVAGEGSFEPTELVVPEAVDDSSASADKPGISG